MNEDRRHYSRVKFDANIAVLKGEQTYPAHLADISLNGAFVRFEGPPPLGKEESCILQINLNAGELILAIESKIVFLSEDHIGLQFQEIELECLTHLRRLLELNMGDSDKVREELFFLATHHKQQ